MKMKKLSLLLASCLMVGSLAGCGSTDKEEPSTGGDDTAVEKTVLKIAALEGGYGTEHWNKLEEAYEAENENVDIELTIAPNLEEVIRPQIQAGNAPDLIYLGMGRPEALTETFINEQALHDLSGVMGMTVPGEDVKVEDKILDGFLDTSATNPYGDATYLAPIFYSPTGLFYNKALFAEKGYEFPTTWDEFFALGDQAKEEGIYLFTYPTSGYLDSMVPAMIAAAGGPEAFDSAMNYEEGFWTSDAATKVLETVAKLKDYIAPETVANANSDGGFKNNQQMILDNKALFCPNGTWLPGEMADAPRADGFEWGFGAYPSFETGADTYSLNFFEQMYIPAEAQNIEEAEKFMAYMYSDEAVAIIAEHGANAVIPVEGAIDIAGDFLDELSIEMLSVYDNGAKPIMGNFAAAESVEGLDWKGIYVGTVDSIMNGTKTVADWQADLTAASDKLRANIIK